MVILGRVSRVTISCPGSRGGIAVCAAPLISGQTRKVNSQKCDWEDIVRRVTRPIRSRNTAGSLAYLFMVSAFPNKGLLSQNARPDEHKSEDRHDGQVSVSHESAS